MAVWWGILTFALVEASIANESNDTLDVVLEGAAASICVTVTQQETADTPISRVLCSNFIEVGFGYQVEGTWSEMLYNRSFEKWVPLRPSSTNWCDLENVAHGDWTSAPRYHTAYEHNRWYAWPGGDAPFHIGPDSTLIIDRSAEWRVRVNQVSGRDHGTHCLGSAWRTTRVLVYGDRSSVEVAHPVLRRRFRGGLRPL